MHAAVAMKPNRDDLEYERRVLIGELSEWGKWIESHHDFEGYPSLNILVTHLSGHGGQVGHRVLCLEMPIRVYATHQRVLRLPDPEQDAIQIRHVTVLGADGVIMSIEERCRVIGLSEDAYRKRLSRAYQRIMGINPL